MDFVVGENALAGWIRAGWRYSWPATSLPRRVSNPPRPPENRSRNPARSAGAMPAKVLVLQAEWRGRFRPHDQAGIFARGVHADLLKLVEIAGVHLHPVRLDIRRIARNWSAPDARRSAGFPMARDSGRRNAMKISAAAVGHHDFPGPLAAGKNRVGDQRAVGGDDVARARKFQ